MRHTNGLPVFTQPLPIIWHMTDFISAGNINYADREETGDGSSKTNIIVKPDGSRVLVVTMNIGGMETNMSLKISGGKGSLWLTSRKGQVDYGYYRIRY